MENLKTAIEKLEEAQLEIFQIYLEKISGFYKSNPQERDYIIKRLEKIIEIADGKKIRRKKEPYTEVEGSFDNLEARALKVRSGLTQGEISKMIGITQPCISNYESGKVIPSPHTKEGSVYLESLKNSGYNPFNT